MNTSKNLDFEVLKERWGKYTLDDGSTLKIRFILTNVRTFKENEKIRYNTTIQNIQTIYAGDRLMGKPDLTVFTIETLQKNIEKNDLSFDPIEIPSNEYLLDNGTKLKAFAQVIRIDRTSCKNSLGEPIYMVSTNVTINFTDMKLNQ